MFIHNLLHMTPSTDTTTLGGLYPPARGPGTVKLIVFAGSVVVFCDPVVLRSPVLERL